MAELDPFRFYLFFDNVHKVRPIGVCFVFGHIAEVDYVAIVRVSRARVKFLATDIWKNSLGICEDRRFNESTHKQAAILVTCRQK